MKSRLIVLCSALPNGRWNSYHERQTHRVRESNFLISNFSTVGISRKHISCSSLLSIFYCSHTGLPIPQGSVNFLVAMVPIINELEKGMRKINSSRIKLSYSLFSPRQGSPLTVLHVSSLLLFYCCSHARLSVLRLGKCLCRNFSTDIHKSKTYCKGHILGPLESANTTFWDWPRSYLEAISIPP